MVHETVQRIWYTRHPARWLLAPWSGAFCVAALVRRRLHRAGRVGRSPVPVLVVGNITAGGTCKTPLVIALVEALRARGWRPGVISRGHGGRRREDPLPVTVDTSPLEAGDEPVLIARRAECPVVVGRKRTAALSRLLRLHPECDVVLADDGLQHYQLYRDLEIAVVDGQRGFGNGWCLPAGPLREPVSRLRTVDWVVLQGPGPVAGVEPDACMALLVEPAYNLQDPRRRRPLERFAGEAVAALAGIGDPQRFFAMLRTRGLRPLTRAFDDHHVYRASDLSFAGRRPLLMTEKDAVKIRPFARPWHWVVPVRARVGDGFFDEVSRALDAVRTQMEEEPDG